MTEFPSPIDREVASSLLLLSSGISYFSSSSDRSGSEGKFISVDEGSFVSAETRSCESSLYNTASSRKSYECDFMNFKIAKKRRTNVIWSSVDPKPKHSKNYEFYDISKCSCDSKEESCLSTGSSEISSTESRITETISHEKMYSNSKIRESHRSSSIRRRAIKILEFLSTSCSSSEIKIRQVLGDSADTSKALRMLLKMGNVKRSGAGGKSEPFVYKIA